MRSETNIQIIGRNKQELIELDEYLSGSGNFSVSTRHISNGSLEPLHSLDSRQDIALVCLSNAWQDELEALGRQPPASRPPVIVIANTEDEVFVMRQAMRAGTRDVLTRPVDKKALLEILVDLSSEKMVRGREEGVLTAVINAKGGSGATMLAANIAHVLARKGKRSVALVDMDIQFGTVALYLDVQPSMGISEVLQYSDQLDEVALQAYMTSHVSGLQILGTTHTPGTLSHDISVDKLQHLLETMRAIFQHVVVDVPRQIDIATMTALESADNIVIVTQQSLSHLRDTKRLLGILTGVGGIDRNRILVAVNRFDKKVAITLAEIRKMLENFELAVVPNDYARVTENINIGVPLYDQAHNAVITKSIIRLAEQLDEQMITEKAGLLHRMFNRLGTSKGIN